MRKTAPINVIVHYPKDALEVHRMLKHIAEENTDLFITALRETNRPTRQKIDVINAVFDTEYQRNSARKRLRNNE